MDDHAKLREIVARLCRVEPEGVGPDFSLAPLLAGSINVHLLESAVRARLGVVPPTLHALRSFADLEAAVLGRPGQQAGAASEAPETAGTPAPPGGAEGDLACGLDVEQVSKLPAAQDYWTHEFYAATFTSTEIAYCTRQADPRPHFAARWCAKEALKKCDPAYLGEDPVNIQVRHDERGAPVLQLVRTQQVLPYAVSMTHSDDMAAAVVVRLRSPPRPDPPSGAPVAAVGAVDAPPGRHPSKTAAGALVFGLLGTIVGLLALLRTYGL